MWTETERDAWVSAYRDALAGAPDTGLAAYYREHRPPVSLSTARRAVRAAGIEVPDTRPPALRVSAAERSAPDPDTGYTTYPAERYRTTPAAEPPRPAGESDALAAEPAPVPVPVPAQKISKIKPVVIGASVGVGLMAAVLLMRGRRPPVQQPAATAEGGWTTYDPNQWQYPY